MESEEELECSNHLIEASKSISGFVNWGTLFIYKQAKGIPPISGDIGSCCDQLASKLQTESLG